MFSVLMSRVIQCIYGQVTLKPLRVTPSAPQNRFPLVSPFQSHKNAVHDQLTCSTGLQEGQGGQAPLDLGPSEDVNFGEDETINRPNRPNATPALNRPPATSLQRGIRGQRGGDRFSPYPTLPSSKPRSALSKIRPDRTPGLSDLAATGPTDSHLPGRNLGENGDSSIASPLNIGRTPSVQIASSNNSLAMGSLSVVLSNSAAGSQAVSNRPSAGPSTPAAITAPTDRSPTELVPQLSSVNSLGTSSKSVVFSDPASIGGRAESPTNARRPATFPHGHTSPTDPSTLDSQAHGTRQGSPFSGSIGFYLPSMDRGVELSEPSTGGEARSAYEEPYRKPSLIDPNDPGPQSPLPIVTVYQRFGGQLWDQHPFGRVGESSNVRPNQPVHG
jgi:hypothetical protein